MKNKFYNRRLEEIENKINSTNLTNLEKNDLMSNIESLVAHELITIKSLYGTKIQKIGVDNMEDIKQVIKELEYTLKEHEQLKNSDLDINNINRLLDLD